MSGGSLWGAHTPVSGTMSLAQIQQQEERDRQQRELKLQAQLQAQQREQQARGVPSWAERSPVVNPPVKSLLQIQQEQAQQQNKRQQGPALSRSQVRKEKQWFAYYSHKLLSLQLRTCFILIFCQHSS